MLRRRPQGFPIRIFAMGQQHQVLSVDLLKVHPEHLLLDLLAALTLHDVGLFGASMVRASHFR